LAEFTGERVIPDEVDPDLLNEHLARYAFAARLVRGKRVLDAGCGAGYGAAELARTAVCVAGADISAEAVAYAREHYRFPNLFFAQASCGALPYPDASFDLVVGFEVIEHLTDWRGFLIEARRVLAPNGQFIVSTPNRLYYGESRGGVANPFHQHEFDYEEFRGELSAVFPYISLFIENHTEGVVFQPVEPGGTAEVRVDGVAAEPRDAHFFVAVCAHRPQTGNPAYVYIPGTANVLRERERHIRLLEEELRTKNDWLARSRQEHQELVDLFRLQKDELERSNRWAEEQNRKLEEKGARILELQEEVVREQAAAQAVVEGYEVKIAALEQECRNAAEWAQRTRHELDEKLQELARCVEHLTAAEQTVVERTEWAQRLEAELQHLQAQLAMVRASRWVRTGRKLGLGPTLPES